MPISTLSCADPLDAVFLRILAWEAKIAGKEFKKRGLLYEHLTVARKELGLKQTTGGAPSQYISDLIKKTNLLAENFEHTDSGWLHEWRIINIPPHSAVRQLSQSPVADANEHDTSACKSFNLTFRHPAVPQVTIYIDKGAPDPKVFAKKRGVYFLRLEQELYIGRSDEFNVRYSQHLPSKMPKWWVFIEPVSDPDFGKDEQEATEALLISYWNEIAKIYNNNRGSEWEPSYPRLQKAILLTMAASATFIWLVRDQKQMGIELAVDPGCWSIPFKSSKKEGWSKCYLSGDEQGNSG